MTDDLRVQIARLEERMKTMQAEYKTDIALLARQIVEQEARNTERSGRWAERQIVNIRWLAATIFAAAGLSIAAVKWL